jgi:hypothetical protein
MVLTQCGIIPKFAIIPPATGFKFDSMRFDPIRWISGETISFGYRMGNFASLTSEHFVSGESYE